MDIDNKILKLQRHRTVVAKELAATKEREIALVTQNQKPSSSLDEVFEELGFKKALLIQPGNPSARINSQPKVGVCGKHTFNTQGQCERAIVNRLNKANDADRLIAYFCNKCHGWHMSSRDSRMDR